METLRVGAAQVPSAPGDVRRNARTAAEVVRRAGELGVRLVVFPELSLIGYDLAAVRDRENVVTADDVRLDVLRDTARAAGVTAVVGAACRREGGAVWIAALAACPDGQVHVHGKRYLHGPERDLFQPGGEGVVLNVDGWKVALAVCYDAGVPDHAAEAARRGAEVYAGSVLYDTGEARRFDVHFAARAMDHRMYAVAANYPCGEAGLGAGWASCGASGVWHPDGRRIHRAGADSGLLLADLAHAELQALRARDTRAGYPRGAT
ncbi:carbon-nitrogen hydrolase family protein [Actinocorallia sp. API 0066]|uniref:carbon-nitrogen hydrolase family protein n=1 Tax=Actinocorallia sp. API 0066 TaxID=2896846 RepID=UPI001E3FEBC6|nr:carbon-nitrogen hydrolase family protein [Actinocorallia sp. API 0066]MCD0449704.1 carbon-nitrogen hydrolase family protein [Actinocorallia sp. API 0066]